MSFSDPFTILERQLYGPRRTRRNHRRSHPTSPVPVIRSSTRTRSRQLHDLEDTLMNECIDGLSASIRYERICFLPSSQLCCIIVPSSSKHRRQALPSLSETSLALPPLRRSPRFFQLATSAPSQQPSPSSPFPVRPTSLQPLSPSAGLSMMEFLEYDNAHLYPSSSTSSATHHERARSLDAGRPQAGPLDVKVEVKLDEGGDRLELIGGSRTGTHYSLAGHVLVTVPYLGEGPHVGELNRFRELKSLELAFEGKSEYYDEQGRYECVRLIYLRRQLLDDASRPYLISHTSNTLGKESIYAIGFDIAVPGWLPATFSTDLGSTSYGLIGIAGVGWSDTVNPTKLASAPVPISSNSRQTALQPAAQQSRLFPRLAKSFASVFVSQGQYQSSYTQECRSSWQPIVVERHRAQATSDTSEQTLRHFTLKPDPQRSISPVECVVSVPEVLDISGNSLKVSVRLRARKQTATATSMQTESAMQTNDGQLSRAGVMQPNSGNEDVDMDRDLNSIEETQMSTPPGSLSAAEDSCLVRMVELGMEVEEIEKYTSVPSQSFLSTFPVPEHQPNLFTPAEDPNGFQSPASTRFQMSMSELQPASPARGCNSRTLLLGDDGQPRTYRFEGEGLELGDGWRKVNIIIPLPAEGSGQRRPLPEIETPFLRIKHKVKIRVVCRSELTPGQDTIVVLTTPLRCGTPSARPSPFGGRPRTTLPTSASLPAYCEIFHENGSAREEEEPLPPYENQEAPAYAPPASVAVHISPETFLFSVPPPQSATTSTPLCLPCPSPCFSELTSASTVPPTTPHLDTETESMSSSRGSARIEDGEEGLMPCSRLAMPNPPVPKTFQRAGSADTHASEL